MHLFSSDMEIGVNMEKNVSLPKVVCKKGGASQSDMRKAVTWKGRDAPRNPKGQKKISGGIFI